MFLDPTSFDFVARHEARNGSEQDRIVLLLDFLRPGVDPAAVGVAPPEVARMVDQYSER